MCKKYNKMHTILNSTYKIFKAVYYIQTDDIFWHFMENPDVYVPYISKNIKGRNLKETPNVLHISKLWPV